MMVMMVMVMIPGTVIMYQVIPERNKGCCCCGVHCAKSFADSCGFDCKKSIVRFSCENVRAKEVLLLVVTILLYMPDCSQ